MPDDVSIMDPRRPQNPILRALDKGISQTGEGAYRVGSTLAAGMPGMLHTGARILGDIGEPDFMGRAQKSVEAGQQTSQHILKSLEEMGPHTMYHDQGVREVDKALDVPNKLAHVPDELLGKAGYPGLAMAAGLIGDVGLNEVLKGPGKGKARKISPSVTDWEAMTPQAAQEYAASGGHLRASKAQGRGFIGGPEWVKNKRDLNVLRRRIDKAIAEGAPIPIDENGTTANDWYPEARASNAAVTSSPENASKLANVTGVYSARKAVPTDIDLALKHHTMNALYPPEEAVAKMKDGQGALPLEPEKAGAIFSGDIKSPEDVRALGPKVGPFSAAIDPFAEKVPNTPVNDTRMLEFFGYGNPSPKDTQHNFMTGELHAGLKRALEKGTLPPGSDVHSAQASIWSTIPGRGGEQSAEGLGSFLRKHAVNVTHEPGSPGAPNHLAGLNDEPMSIRREHAANMSWKDGAGQDALYKALDVPQTPVTEGMGNWETQRPDLRPLEASIHDPKTGEVFGGNKAGDMHSDAYFKMDPDAMNRFEEHPETFTHGFTGPDGQFLTRTEATELANALKKEPGNDPRLGRAGTYFEQHHDRAGGQTSLSASEDFKGVQPSKKPAVRIEHNPLEAAHPLLPWDDENARSLLHQTETFRSGMDAQTGYGWNRVKELSSKNNHMANALKVPNLFEEGMSQADKDLATRTLFTKAKRAGLQLIDNGKGNFTLTGKEFSDTSPSNFQDLLGKMDPNSEATEMLKGLGKPGTLESGYGENPYGEGALTEHMKNTISPRVAQKLHNPEISKILLDHNEAERLADMSNRGALKSGPRADIQKLRGMTAEHGLEGVWAQVEEKMADSDGRLTFKQAAASLGLPAYLIAALGGEHEPDGKANGL